MGKHRNKPEMFDDPVVPDEHDPDFMEGMFELHKYRGTKPEELVVNDPFLAEKYAAWLKDNE